MFYKMMDGELMIVWTYVDDLGALVVKDTMWHTFYRDISSVFEVEETEVSWFLGMHVEHGEGWTTLDMTKCINDKLIIYNLQDANHADTPMALKFAEGEGPPLNQDQLVYTSTSLCVLLEFGFNMQDLTSLKLSTIGVEPLTLLFKT